MIKIKRCPIVDHPPLSYAIARRIYGDSYNEYVEWVNSREGVDLPFRLLTSVGADLGFTQILDSLFVSKKVPGRD